MNDENCTNKYDPKKPDNYSRERRMRNDMLFCSSCAKVTDGGCANYGDCFGCRDWSKFKRKM